MAGRNLIFSHLNGCTDSYSAFFKFEIRNSNLKYPPYVSTRRNSYVVYVLFRHAHEDAKIPPRGLNRLEHSAAVKTGEDDVDGPATSLPLGSF